MMSCFCSQSSVLHSQPKSTVGTPAYIAPEVLSKKEYDGKVLHMLFSRLCRHTHIHTQYARTCTYTIEMNSHMQYICIPISLSIYIYIYITCIYIYIYLRVYNMHSQVSIKFLDFTYSDCRRVVMWRDLICDACWSLSIRRP